MVSLSITDIEVRRFECYINYTPASDISTDDVNSQNLYAEGDSLPPTPDKRGAFSPIGSPATPSKKGWLSGWKGQPDPKKGHLRISRFYLNYKLKALIEAATEDSALIGIDDIGVLQELSTALSTLSSPGQIARMGLSFNRMKQNAESLQRTITNLCAQEIRTSEYQKDWLIAFKAMYFMLCSLRESDPLATPPTQADSDQLYQAIDTAKEQVLAKCHTIAKMIDEEATERLPTLTATMDVPTRASLRLSHDSPILGLSDLEQANSGLLSRRSQSRRGSTSSDGLSSASFASFSSGTSSVDGLDYFSPAEEPQRRDSPYVHSTKRRLSFRDMRSTIFTDEPQSPVREETETRTADTETPLHLERDTSHFEQEDSEEANHEVSMLIRGTLTPQRQDVTPDSPTNHGGGLEQIAENILAEDHLRNIEKAAVNYLTNDLGLHQDKTKAGFKEFINSYTPSTQGNYFPWLWIFIANVKKRLFLALNQNAAAAFTIISIARHATSEANKLPLSSLNYCISIVAELGKNASNRSALRHHSKLANRLQPFQPVIASPAVPDETCREFARKVAVDNIVLQQEHAKEAARHRLKEVETILPAAA